MDAELLPGIGGFPVERMLGSGGMGVVYLCRDQQLERPVAIKVLRPELLEHGDMRQRFAREARALARVSSPCVVSVYAVGDDAVLGPFVVMELLEGEDLQARLKRAGPLPWREACAMVRDACTGLMAAHDAGLVHRDVKPANLFLSPGRAKLTDFGLAREVQGTASVTQAGLVVGTPAYLAPELVRGGAASASSDLYSLGATLFHAIAGQAPFPGDAPLEVLTDAVSKAPPRLDAVVPEVPLALAELVDHMLKKEPGTRPASIAEVDARLKAILDGIADAPRAEVAALPLPAAAVASVGTQPTLAAGIAGSPGGADPLFTSGELSSSGARIRSASVTVMMTDIAGFTARTGRQSRDESARWLALHDALLQPVFRAFGGKVVKTLGDAFLVTFSSPTDAVLCGCAIQDRLFLHNQSARQEDRITVRVALSAGEVRLHKGDVFGEPVNLVARIEALAEPGEVMLSDAVFATMNAAEVRLEKRGEHQLKGIARPVTVYVAVPDGLPTFPPFGGRALARVKDGGLQSLRAALQRHAPKALTRARSVAAPWLARAKRLPKAALAGGVALLLVLLVLPLAWSDGRRGRIRAGQGREVLEEIEQIPASSRSAQDLTDLGFALMSVGSRERAFGAFAAAHKKGAEDDEVLKLALAALSARDDDGAKELLSAWQGSGIDGALRRHLSDAEPAPRHHALDVLEKRKVATDADRVAVGMADLEEDDCMQRRSGVLLLKKAARGAEALSALKRLGNDMPRNLCMVFDVAAAEDAVRRRTDDN